ncbi:MAG: hypothetical protein RL021_678 [Bacteroidota bacterium]
MTSPQESGPTADTSMNLGPATPVSKKPMHSAKLLPPGGDSVLLFNDTLSFVSYPAYVLPYRDTVPAAAQQLNHLPLQKTIELYGVHSLQPVHAGAVPREPNTPDWMFPVLVLMFSVYAGLRIFYSRYFKQMAASLFNVGLANQIVRDENILVQRATVYMSIMFYLTAALFLYLLSEQLHWELPWIGSGFPRFLKFIVLVSGVYALKFLVLRFGGWLFGLERELTTYLFTIFIVNNIQGLLLFPIIVLIAFQSGGSADWMFRMSFFIIGIFYVFRLFRGVQIGLNVPGASLLYLFLYLCTLELAPMLVLFRIIGRT